MEGSLWSQRSKEAGALGEERAGGEHREWSNCRSHGSSLANGVSFECKYKGKS